MLSEEERSEGALPSWDLPETLVSFPEIPDLDPCLDLTISSSQSAPRKTQLMILPGLAWTTKLRLPTLFPNLKGRTPVLWLPQIKANTVQAIAARTVRGLHTVGVVEAEAIQEEEVGVEGVATRVAVREVEKSGAQNGGMQNMRLPSIPSGLINEVEIQ